MLQFGIYIFLVVFWLAVVLFLSFRTILLPNWEPSEAQVQRLQLVHVMAFVFVAWNLARWFMTYRARKERRLLEQQYALKIEKKPDLPATLPEEPST